MTGALVESVVDVGGAPVTVLRGGTGKRLLMLHDELGFPGWMKWNQQLALDHEFFIPLQPGFGHTPRVAWVQDYRDLAIFYARLIREMGVAPIDVVGFSAGGFIAAEMASMSPSLFDRMVLVAPMGIRPLEGEIFDFLATTMTTHVAATVSHRDAEEFGKIYGGAMTAEQFELFEAARGETSRLGWEPFMFNPSLPHQLQGVGDLQTLVVWGEDDLIVPRGAIDAYERALPNCRLKIFPDIGHRPEIENVDGFVECVSTFLLPADH
jgi:pimeloyl-ACP methyl ester carboxylesterase